MGFLRDQQSPPPPSHTAPIHCQVLGCGVMQQAILDDAGRSENKAWAFGCAPFCTSCGIPFASLAHPLSACSLIFEESIRLHS